jgi:hypothetical protein
MLTPFDPDASLFRLVRTAQWAPSVMNTQPWKFEISAGDRIDIRADLNRWLMHMDPRKRELFISCGAALFNLRMALRVTGHDPITWLMPDPDNDPYLLASVEIVVSRPHAPSVVEQSLYAQTRWRHTNRAPFSDTPVGLNIVAELEHVAWRERTHLWLLHRRLSKELLSEIATADQKFDQDQDYRSELRQYTSASATGFGIPDSALGPLPPKRQKDHIPYRDLGLESPANRRVLPFEKHTRLLALATDNDTPLDWLRAGQGLQRVLLTAARRNVTASFYTQPLELADRYPGATNLRWPWPKYVQMIMRIGYGPAPAHTPREGRPKVLDKRTDPPVLRRPGRAPQPVP